MMEGHMLAMPTKAQLEWQDLEIGMFIHFNMFTYAPDYDPSSYGPAPDAKLFNPVKLDAGQWASAAKLMGAKYAVLTAKHPGGAGFCLWPTKTTSYSVKSSPWRNGNGDVVKEFVTAFRENGIKVGIYCSAYEPLWEAGPGGVVVSGDSVKQEQYNKIYLEQLEELLSNYGELVEIWFDGSIDPRVGPDVGPLIKRLQPDAMVFQSVYATIRWVGNEDGVAPYPFWNAVEPEQVDEFSFGRGHTDGTGSVWLPGECDTCLRDHHWGWLPGDEHNVKSLDELMEIYYKSVGRGCNLLLNAAPDRDGLIPEVDMMRYAEFGAEIKQRFEKPVAMVRDSWGGVELNLGKPTQIDHIVTMEDISEGQRIREYVIEADLDGGWKEIIRGSSIGHKKIDQVKPLSAKRVRLRCLEAFAEPVKIRSFAVYNCGAK